MDDGRWTAAESSIVYRPSSGKPLLYFGPELLAHGQLAEPERVLPAKCLRLTACRVVHHQRKPVCAGRSRRIESQRYILAHAVACLPDLERTPTAAEFAVPLAPF